MKILVACEYSGRVREAFTAKGHDVTSCDMLPTDIPGKHYQGDVLDIIDDGWDMMIAHPPCTYLTVSAEWAYKDEPIMIKGKPKNIKTGTLTGYKRRQARGKALDFVFRLWMSGIEKICIENPVGVINRYQEHMPKPQYVQQYWFGEDASKKTGLWLKALPPLIATEYIEPRIVNGLPRWGNQTDSGQNKETPTLDRWKVRSTTPQGLALAMAEQWG